MLGEVGTRRPVKKGSGSPLRQHPSRLPRHGMEQGGDGAAPIAVGAKGESEEGFLEIIVTVEEHPLILKIGGNAAARVYKGFPDGGPGRSPALSRLMVEGCP